LQAISGLHKMMVRRFSIGMRQVESGIMRKLVQILPIVMLLALPFREARAQDLPSAIVVFTSDVATITVAEAENEEIVATFTWRTIGMTADDRLYLQAYRAGDWVEVSTIDNTSLAPNGAISTRIQHSLGFAPPTYRLMLYDATGRVVDERTLVISYFVPDRLEAPTIASFTSTRSSLSPTEFASGNALVPVTWEVAGRQPYTNLAFEQLFEDGSRLSVELPRPVRWIPSRGEGVLAPILPDGATVIHLHLSLIDLLGEIVLDEATLEIPVDNETISGRPGPGGGSGGFVEGNEPPPAIFATITPKTATYGDTITITWRMNGITSFAVTVVLGSGAVLPVFSSNQTSGTRTYILPPGTYTEARFTLTATNASGLSRNRVEVVTIR
jgi:hypothetical protein